MRRTAITLLLVPYLVVLSGCSLLSSEEVARTPDKKITRQEKDEWEGGLSKAGPGGSSYIDFSLPPSDAEAVRNGPGFFRKHWGKLVAAVIAIGGGGTVGFVAAGKTTAAAGAGTSVAGTAVATGAGGSILVEQGPGALLDPNAVNENASNPAVGIQNLVDANVLTYDQMVAAGMPSHLAVELVSLQHQLELWAAGMSQGVNEFVSLVTVAREARLIITLIDGLRESGMPYNPLTAFTVRNILDKLATWIEREHARRRQQN